MRKQPDHYQAPDPQQARFNRGTVDALEFILQRAGVSYDVVTVDVQTTATLVPHRLGRAWSGWMVVDTETNTNVWRSATATATELRVQSGSTSPSTKILVF